MWTYRTEAVDYDHVNGTQNLDEAINKLVRQGWEFVSAQHMDTESMFVLFFRKLG